MTSAVKQLFSHKPASTRAKNTAAETPDSPAGKSVGVVESLVAPKQVMIFGRQLSFSIEEDAIQIAVSRRWGRITRLIDVRKVYLPSAAAATADLRQAFVARTIEEVFQEFGRKVASVAITVSGPETAFRQLTLPVLSHDALESSVNFQARKTLPFPTNDCWFDHRVTYRQAGGDADRYRISLVGATRRHIEERLQPFRALGVPVQFCHLAQDVIGQLLRHLPDFSDQANYALINIERNRSEMSYFKGSNLEFSHILSVGSSFLANRTDATMFEYFAESLASEIQNSLDYYSGQSIGLFSSKLFIYGDLAYSDDLIALLENRFDFEFKRFPVENLKFVRQNPIESEAPLGVCLPVVGAAVNSAVLPNLIPESDKLAQKRRTIERRILAAVAAVFIAIGLFWSQQYVNLTNDRARLAQLTNQVNDFKNSNLYGSYQRVKLQIAASQNYLEQAEAHPSYLGVALKELTAITPPSVRLLQFGLQPSNDGRNSYISGTVQAGSAPPEVILAEFVENLAASVVFDDVNIVHYAPRVVDGDSYLDFELEMKVQL